MKKIVLYGMGKVFHRIESHITNGYEIVAICDIKFLNKHSEKYYNGIPLVSPSDLELIDYDYIVICSNKFFESMRTYLIGTFYACEDKIVSARFFFDEDFICDYSLIRFYEDRIKMHNRITTFDENVISNLFKSIATLRDNSFLDLALIFGIRNISIYEVDYKHTEIIWLLSYRDVVMGDFDKIFKEFVNYYDVNRVAFYSGVVFEFKHKKQRAPLDATIYVVSHKPYNIIRNELYEPLMVGGEATKCGHGERQEGIDDLNHILNECTALYWIWKNAKAEIVGLNHYRRLFCNDEIINYDNVLNAARISELLSKNDIILPSMTFLDWSVYENIASAVGDLLARKGFDIISALLKEKQPEYYDNFTKVMNGNVLYACNMFVAYHGVMDEYCDWLFSFIIDAANQLDVSGCTAQQTRTIGYYAETMMTVWLLHKNIKAYSLPIILL